MEKAKVAYLVKHGYKEFCPKVALFDMDGVLYDSMPNHAKAWRESMASYGLDMSEEEAYAFEGMRGFETIKIVAGKQWGREISDDESADMYRVKSDCYSACPTAKMMDGTYALQQEMRRCGLEVGVVTGSGQLSLLDRVKSDYAGLVNPDIFVTALNIEKGKPAPDPYLKGMELAGRKPWETVVVENAPLGVRAGVAAGAFTVAVNTGPLPDEMLLCEGADLLFHSMDEFRDSLNDILSPFSGF
ncbi:MAG: HAD hydrolase-like protein [Bacteroidales bacterium]|nr:HAD hydrolase-like protein [Bacteroidales bacterium]MCM1147633.1 HAD hydrolase-like protein [Bacteroidales bacterium]MCM1206424.1 HAD hydrolase-like protein [Bacillota bacterium]